MKALEKWNANISTRNVEKAGGNGFLPPKLPVLPWYNYWISKCKTPRSPRGWQSRGGPCVSKSDNHMYNHIKVLLRVLGVGNHSPPHAFSTFWVEIFAFHFSSPIISHPNIFVVELFDHSVWFQPQRFYSWITKKWDYGKWCIPIRVSHCLPRILESWVECRTLVVDSETSLFSSVLEFVPFQILYSVFNFRRRSFEMQNPLPFITLITSYGTRMARRVVSNRESGCCKLLGGVKQGDRRAIGGLPSRSFKCDQLVYQKATPNQRVRGRVV